MSKNLLFAFLLIFSFTVARAQVTESDRAEALSLIGSNSAVLGLSQEELDNSVITGSYIVPGSDVRIVHLQQSHKGILVYNQLHVLAFKDGKLASKEGSRVVAIEGKATGNGVPGIDPVKAVQTALKEANTAATELIVPQSISKEGKRFDFGHLGASSEKVFAELLWFPMEDNSVKLVWQVFVAPYKTSDYWLMRVDAYTNEVINKENMTISCNWGPADPHNHPHAEVKKTQAVRESPVQQNFVSLRDEKKEPSKNNFLINTATYRVVKYPAESPTHPGGNPQLVTDPWLISPGNATTLGWHDDGNVTYDSTRGNNVFAYEDRDANNLPGYAGLSSSPQPNLTFDFPPDFTQAPIIRSPAPNQQFNTTNLFYWNNMIHDLAYIYGFTETARNYQNSNMGRGGVGGDYVLAEAQDGSGTNNANFSSGVEGTRGRMQMYLWTAPNPDRDGDVDNGIIAHEYTHGISNRMTGTGAGCLTGQEQMGEGWSDYLALMITHDWSTATVNDGFNLPRGIGTYALNQPPTGVGIRQYRYTTNMAINPLTYANLPSVAVPHGVGTIWCTALWDMTWYIIQQTNSINPNIYNIAGGGGNAIALKLVIEGLRLQPCGPGFITGRNAILKADTLFFGAQYSCAILEAFARRGMGIGASQGSAAVRGDETISFVDGRPVIGTQPANASVCTGANHTFSVAATGANLSYQWQLSTDGGTIYNDIAGATASGYTVTGVTLAMNNYRYRCIITGCPPSVTSNAGILTVASAPTVDIPPANATVCEGANTSFTVAASGGTINYQWQVSTNGGANYSNIPGATGSTLNLTAVTVSMNNNMYRCVLSSPGCGASVNSLSAVLTVNANTAINAQPVGATVCAGTSTNICVTASGSGLGYQWQSSTACGGAWTNIPGATSSCLTVANPAATASYRCVVSGTCGASTVTSDCVTLTVIDPVTVTSQSANTEVCSGSNTGFSVSATSNQTINYQWQLSTDGGNTWNNLPNSGVYSGVTTSALAITGATISLDGNRYRCQMSTATCVVPLSSNAALLTVRQLPTVTLSASPLTELLPGQLTTLTAVPSASTGGVLSTLWFLNNTQVPNAGNTRLVNVEQTGAYKVRVQETFGSGITCASESSELVIGAKVSDRLFIFPSPNDGRFTVSYYNNGGNSTQRRIIVVDAKGSRVYDRLFPVTGPYTLIPVDLRVASRGIYIVLVGDAAGNKLAEGKVHVR